MEEAAFPTSSLNIMRREESSENFPTSARNINDRVVGNRAGPARSKFLLFSSRDLCLYEFANSATFAVTYSCSRVDKMFIYERACIFISEVTSALFIGIEYLLVRLVSRFRLIYQWTDVPS